MKLLDRSSTQLDKFNISERKSIYPVENSIYHSLIKSNPMNVYMPRHFESMAKDIWNFKLRKDDIFIVTYPKCGTTLTQELMWQIANDVQVESEMSKIPILARAPWIELSCVFHPNLRTLPLRKCFMILSSSSLLKLFYHQGLNYLVSFIRMDGKNSIKFIDNFPSPRIIKSHLPVAMLPPNILDTAKILYIAR